MEGWDVVLLVCIIETGNNLGWKGPIGHLVQPPTQNRPDFEVRLNCSRHCLVEFSVSPGMESPPVSGPLLQCLTTVIVKYCFVVYLSAWMDLPLICLACKNAVSSVCSVESMRFWRDLCFTHQGSLKIEIILDDCPFLQTVL